MMSLVDRYSHVLMIRTVSKMGLAGLRLGWMLGDKLWLKELDKIRLPYNINALTQASANFALQNITVFNQQAEKICQQRGLLLKAMQAIENIKVFPSEANFILFKILSSTAENIHKILLDNKIIIKNVSNNDLLENCLRVTVGTEEENKYFIKALNSALS